MTMNQVISKDVIGASPSAARILRAGIVAGLVAGLATWAYEFIVYANVLHLMSIYTIAARGSTLVFGPAVESLGIGALFIGIAVHFVTSCLWGILFAAIWPSLGRLDVEASLAGVVLGLIASPVMGFILINFSPINIKPTREQFLLSVIFHTLPFGIPLALTTKYLLRGTSGR